MPPPLITLTTDFGIQDHFVGVMKGVIYGICPEAQIVDLSHSVEPFHIVQAAFLVSQSWRYFPPGTVHVVVVDPGVGSSRRALLAGCDNQFFVGPDNGVLSTIYRSVREPIVRTLTNTSYFLQTVSATFHGRDVFAPVAAHLAKGAAPDSFGDTIDDYVLGYWDQPQRISRRVWSGTVLHVDRFGNLITNFPVEEFASLQLRGFELSIGTRRLERLVNNYAEGSGDEPFLVFGSSNLLEIAVNQGNAGKLLGCGVGSPCELQIY
jgi:S-adenosylmethionine hydrolase